MKLWIARNKDNTIAIFQSKPILNDKQEWDEILNEDFMLIPEYSFPEVTFENSPQEVKLKLVSEIVGVAESPSKTFPRVNDFEVGASYRR